MLKKKIYLYSHLGRANPEANPKLSVFSGIPPPKKKKNSPNEDIKLENSSTITSAIHYSVIAIIYQSSGESKILSYLFVSLI